MEGDKEMSYRTTNIDIPKPPTGGSKVKREPMILELKVSTNLDEIEAQLERIEKQLDRISNKLEKIDA
jgi:hypothetical protein